MLSGGRVLEGYLSLLVESVEGEVNLIYNIIRGHLVRIVQLFRLLVEGKNKSLGCRLFIDEVPTGTPRLGYYATTEMSRESEMTSLHGEHHLNGW